MFTPEIVPQAQTLFFSRLLDWLIKLSNSRFGQGYYSFNRQYIEPLPIVPIDFSTRGERRHHDRIVELVQETLVLYKKSATVKTPHERLSLQRQIDASDREIDQLVYELYGLTDEEIRIVEEATAAIAK